MHLLYMSLCNRDLELIGSFRPVIPVMNEIYYICHKVHKEKSDSNPINC